MCLMVRNGWLCFGLINLQNGLIPQYRVLVDFKICSLKYQMKNNQSDSLQNIDHTAVSEISPDDIINADLSEVKSSSPSSGRLAYLRCNIKKYLFIALLLISSSVFVYEINAAGPIIMKPPSSDDKPDDVHIAPFNFLVYCPESYHKEPPT